MLTVTRLDRLARSSRDLLNTLAAITGKKAGFKSIGDTWANTTTSHGRLDADRAWRAGGVRARFNPHAHWRGAGRRTRPKNGPRSNSPITRSARPSSAATKARRSPTSPAATTSALRRFPDLSREKIPMFRPQVLAAMTITVIGLALAPAARAEWWIGKVGGETCVPLEELGTDGKYHSAHFGMIHAPEDYIHVVGGRDLNLTPEPNTPVGMIMYKLGPDAHIVFFSDRNQCQQAIAAMGH